jgi:hypothetical protein
MRAIFIMTVLRGLFEARKGCGGSCVTRKWSEQWHTQGKVKSGPSVQSS